MKDVLTHYKQEVYNLQINMLDTLVQRLQARGYTVRPVEGHPHLMNPLRAIALDRFWPDYLVERRLPTTSQEGVQVEWSINAKTYTVTAKIEVVTPLTGREERYQRRWNQRAWEAGNYSKYRTKFITMSDQSLDKLVARIAAKNRSTAKHSKVHTAELAAGKLKCEYY